MAARQPHFSPKQVAAALRASESSVKRWCDRGVIRSTRTVGGHRRITLEALQQFLRESKWSLQDPGELGLEAEADLDAVAAGRGMSRDQQAFLAALVRGEEATCARLLHDQIAAGRRHGAAAEHLVTGAMHAIGDAWHCHDLDIYHERRACGICTRLINQLKAELPAVPDWAPVAIGGTLAGDHYQVATALIELSLCDSGWNATNLGSNLPAESFLQAATEYRPKLVWISVSAIADLSPWTDEFNRLAAGLGAEVSLIIGGNALSESILRRLQYTACFESISKMSELTSMMHFGSASR